MDNLSNDALNSFMLYIGSERKYSEYTISNYNKDVLEFDAFLQQNSFGSLTKPSTNSGRYYTAFLNEHYRKPRSVSRKLSSLRSFYKFCTREGYCEINPFLTVSSPKLDKIIRNCLDLCLIHKAGGPFFWTARFVMGLTKKLFSQTHLTCPRGYPTHGRSPYRADHHLRYLQSCYHPS